MKIIIRYTVVALLTFIILLGTLFIPKTVYNKKDMEAIKLGYPVSFITQDVTKHDPPFPWKYSFESPWENSFNISWFNFLVSYLIIFLVVSLTTTWIESLYIKTHTQ